MRGLLRRFHHVSPTPRQRIWISRTLACTGGVLLWRGFHTQWPSLWLALVGLVLFVLTFVCVFRLQRLARSQVSLQRMLGLGIPVVLGGLMNLVVVIANNGYMPCAITTTTFGMWMPMDGARLPYLGDWVFGFISPGDVLIVIGMVAIVATMIRTVLARRRAIPAEGELC